MKYYAIIDTNVVVSAMLKGNSPPSTIVEFAFNGPVVPVLNKEIEDEYRDVLSRPKFHLSKEIVDAIISAFHDNGLYIDAEHINIDLPDPKDLVFYEVTMEERKTEPAYLVTGNIRHFPSKPFIVTPREMLNIILHDREL